MFISDNGVSFFPCTVFVQFWYVTRFKLLFHKIFQQEMFGMQSRLHFCFLFLCQNLSFSPNPYASIDI